MKILIVCAVGELKNLPPGPHSSKPEVFWAEKGEAMGCVLIGLDSKDPFDFVIVHDDGNVAFLTQAMAQHAGIQPRVAKDLGAAVQAALEPPASVSFGPCAASVWPADQQFS